MCHCVLLLNRLHFHTTSIHKFTSIPKFSAEYVDLLDAKSVRRFSFGSMLTVADEFNGQYDYDIRLNLVGQRKGLFIIQITGGTDENNTEGTYSVAVDAMYGTGTPEDVNGRFTLYFRLIYSI